MGNVVCWDHLLCLNIALFFFGMEIRGELSTSESSNKTGCEGTAGGGISDGSVSDRLSADSNLDRLTGLTLSETPI